MLLSPLALTLSLLAAVLLPEETSLLAIGDDAFVAFTLVDELLLLALDGDCGDAVADVLDDDADVDADDDDDSDGVECCTCCNRRARHSASNAALRSTCLNAASKTTLCVEK
jgi:hypothetical protein